MGFFFNRRKPTPPPPAPPAPAVLPPSTADGNRREAGTPKKPSGGTSARGVSGNAPIQYQSLIGAMRNNMGRMQ